MGHGLVSSDSAAALRRSRDPSALISQAETPLPPGRLVLTMPGDATPVPGSDVSSVGWEGHPCRDDKGLLAVVHHVHLPKIVPASVPWCFRLLPLGGWEWGWDLITPPAPGTPPSSPTCPRVDAQWLFVVLLGREKNPVVLNLVRWVALRITIETDF